MNLAAFGLTNRIDFSGKTGIPARITAVHRERYAIVCERGEGYAKLKPGAYHSGEMPYPTTGDFVALDWQEGGDGRIVETLPRSSYFARRDPSAKGLGEQAVAANFDYVFITMALGTDFNLRRLERYLALAWQSGAVPAVILTKADRVEEHAQHIRAAEKLATGVGVFAISAQTGYGLDSLGEYWKQGKTIVLLGSSGVGKSTLVNAMAGEELMATGAVRARDGRGRHTTSHRQLVLLPSGVMVIDTPGMRELGLWDAEEGLGQSFSDVEEFLGHCKFSDCRHKSEPGCAVREALRSGALSPQRWESYQRLQEEARYSADKTAFLREKEQWHKEISKSIRQMRAVDYRHAPCPEQFTCKVCGALVVPEGAGSDHRNHCPQCLSSLHVDNRPGDRASLCQGVMEPIGVWVRKNGEWALIHRCRDCGTLSSNRVAADDNSTLLMSLAMKPLAAPPFPLWQMGRGE